MSVSTIASATGESQRIAFSRSHRAFTDGFDELRVVRKHPDERERIVHVGRGPEIARGALDELPLLGR